MSETPTTGLPADWRTFWGHVQAALAYARRGRNSRCNVHRFTRELRRRLTPDPRYQDPRIVADTIDAIWAQCPEVRQGGRIQ